MNEESIQKISDIWGIEREEAQKIVNAFEKAIESILAAIRKIVKMIFGIVKDKKISKCKHIYLHTKNRRIKKKQMNRMTDIVLSYIHT